MITISNLANMSHPKFEMSHNVGDTSKMSHSIKTVNPTHHTFKAEKVSFLSS